MSGRRSFSLPRYTPTRWSEGCETTGRRALGPGLLLLLAFVIIGGLAFVGVWFSYWVRTQLPAAASDTVDAAVGLAVGLPAFMALTKMTFAARRRMAPDGRKLMARDQRPPILYLRSFGDDQEEGVTTRTPAASSSEPMRSACSARCAATARSWRSAAPANACRHWERPGCMLTTPTGSPPSATWRPRRGSWSCVPPRRRPCCGKPGWRDRIAGSDQVALFVRGLRQSAWKGFIEQLGAALGAPLPPVPESGAILLYLPGRGGAHPAVGRPTHGR